MQPPAYRCDEPGPTYRGLRLLGPLAEFHRAVDLLRRDTVYAPPSTAIGPADGNGLDSISRADHRPEQAGLFDPAD